MLLTWLHLLQVMILNIWGQLLSKKEGMMRIQKIAQIQGSMTRSRIKQSVDTLQQMVAGTLNNAQVKKDEGLEAEALPTLLIVAEGPD